MGIANLTLAVALPLLFGWGYYGVAAAGAIVLTLKNAVFTPWYAARILGIGVHTFTRSMLPGVIAALLLSVGIAMIGLYFSLDALIPLITIGGAIAMIYLAAMWLFGLNDIERGLFRTYLPEAIR
jgi:membrane protein EpsK